MNFGKSDQQPLEAKHADSPHTLSRCRFHRCSRRLQQARRSARYSGRYAAGKLPGRTVGSSGNAGSDRFGQLDCRSGCAFGRTAG
ncbi:hypothetical protein J8I26_18750 [Herbaspirillum sp. LeCh32-8]|uniref:hypothetical protein n=1 Tax=Herbaspirillum sp. LeCh32-8 TaxID=2821356 RepID=UPI001AE8C03A|nr:hypothetical protein [Herbaspirillum sp. LeCh32-8]MBP0600156.1 hypothetical protein [Herbaspirillum sp. LeCh32-8]